MPNINPIADVLQEATRALPYHATKRAGYDEPAYIKKPAASLRTLVLTKATLPKLNDRGQLVRNPKANMAGEVIPCSTAIANASRVSAAGASMVFLPEHADPVIVETGSNSKIMATAAHPRQFVTVDPAGFAEIADDMEVPTTARPILMAPIDPDSLRQFSVRMKVNHKEQIDRGGQQVADEILASIVAGISQTVDKVFIEAVLATTPATFTLAAAAAKGAKVESLRALVGTAGAGAAFRADGQLIAAGIPAELTATTASTLVGWFERGAVVIGPDVSILAERLNVNGDLTVTAWFSLAAAIPDGDSFWTVA